MLDRSRALAVVHLALLLGCAARDRGALANDLRPASGARSLPSSAPPASTNETANTIPRRALGDCSESLEQGDPRWLARFISTGDMPGPYWLRTYGLGRVGDRASLVIQERSADQKPKDGRAWEWQCTQSTTLVGTVVDRGSQLVFQLAEARSPTNVHEVTCAPRNVRVAGARAVRVDEHSNVEGCSKHRWLPAPDVKQSALVCTTNDPGWLQWRDPQVFAGRPPGLEHVTLDEDDCGDATDGLRLIPADGGFAPVR